MRSFEPIHRRAARRKGGPAALEKLLPKPRSTRTIAKIPDSELLSLASKAVFRAGFVWKIVENKWPGTTKAFGGFDVARVANMSDAKLDELAGDERLIRNRTKIFAVRDNARMMLLCAEEHGSFARMIARWPPDDLIGLWAYLKRNGSRLGGMSAQYFLREIGKDSFMLTNDVVKALVAAKVVDKNPTSKRDLARVQAAFDAWAEETGRPLCQLSRILACSVP